MRLIREETVMRKFTKEQYAKQLELEEHRQMNAIDYFFDMPITYPNSIVSRRTNELNEVSKNIIRFLANQEKDDNALSEHYNKSVLYYKHIRDCVAGIKYDNDFVLQNLFELYENASIVMHNPSRSEIDKIWKKRKIYCGLTKSYGFQEYLNPQKWKSWEFKLDRPIKEQTPELRLQKEFNLPSDNAVNKGRHPFLFCKKKCAIGILLILFIVAYNIVRKQSKK